MGKVELVSVRNYRCSQKLQYKHYNGKKTKREGRGRRVNKDMEFSGVK